MKELILTSTLSGSEEVPTIWGDGEHDDTAGFQALMSGHIFRYMPTSNVEITYDETGHQHINLTGAYILPNGIPPNTIGSEVIYPKGFH